MVKPILAALFLAAAGASLSACHAAELDLGYFVTPPYKSRQLLSQSLLETLLDIPTGSGSSKEIFSGLEQVQKSDGIFTRDVYNETLKLVHPDHLDVSYNTLVNYLNIKTLLKEPPTDAHEEQLAKVKQIVDYLDLVAAIKFRRLLRRSKIAMEMSALLSKDEIAFDRIVMAAFGLHRKAGDDKLLEAAREFNFTNPNLNLAMLVSLAGEGGDYRDDYQAVKSLFDDKCPKIQQPFKNLFAVYNLARTIEQSAKLSRALDRVPARLKKLNEYNRICLSLQNYDQFHQTEDMIKKRLRKMRSHQNAAHE